MSCYAGNVIRLSIFGQSRGKEIGMTLENFPKSFPVDFTAVQSFLRRRAPGRFSWTTSRAEPDIPVFLSGLSNGVTDGTEIKAIIENTDLAPEAEHMIPRPGHADYPAYCKLGYIPLGGGQFSGRMTAPLCIAGALCLQYLQASGISVFSHILKIGSVSDSSFNPVSPSKPENEDFPVLSPEIKRIMIEEIQASQSIGDSVGGEIECAVTGLPVGIGGALFDGLESRLSSLLFGIPGLKQICFGAEPANLHGSSYNDGYQMNNGNVSTETNRHGGILGGMSSGMPLIFRVSFKPTPSISLPQHSVNLKTGENAVLSCSGRNDPCIVPRAVPAVETAAAIGILDAYLEAYYGTERTASSN